MFFFVLQQLRVSLLLLRFANVLNAFKTGILKYAGRFIIFRVVLY